MIYVEVFGGGGSILLNKERSAREILNDKNGNLINLYRVVREHPNELNDRLLYVHWGVPALPGTGSAGTPQ